MIKKFNYDLRLVYNFLVTGHKVIRMSNFEVFRKNEIMEFLNQYDSVKESKLEFLARIAQKLDINFNSNNKIIELLDSDNFRIKFVERLYLIDIFMINLIYCEALDFQESESSEWALMTIKEKENWCLQHEKNYQKFESHADKGPLPIGAFEDALSFTQLHNLLDYLVQSNIITLNNHRKDEAIINIINKINYDKQNLNFKSVINNYHHHLVSKLNEKQILKKPRDQNKMRGFFVKKVFELNNVEEIDAINFSKNKKNFSFPKDIMPFDIPLIVLITQILFDDFNVDYKTVKSLLS